VDFDWNVRVRRYNKVIGVNTSESACISSQKNTSSEAFHF